MKADGLVKRRELLRALAGMATLGLGWPLASRGAACDRDRQYALSALLVKCLEPRSSARVVGIEYLKKVPAEHDVGLLTNRICAEMSSQQCLAHDPSGQTMRQALRARIRRDFAENRTVILQGWVISETEARLCAVVALGVAT